MQQSFLLLPLLLALPTTIAPAVPASIADTLTLRDWRICGPFSVGVREGITGVITDPAQFQPQEGDSFRSALVASGITVCRRVSADSAGWVNTDYPNVSWDSLRDFYGTPVLLAAGYAYTEFDVPQRYRALAIAPKAASFYLNGIAYQGDVYGTGKYIQPVLLDSGRNRLLVSLAGFGDQRFQFLLAPAPSHVIILSADATIPDAIADSSLFAWCGLPVINTTDRRLDSIRVVLLHHDNIIAETTIHNLPGLGVKRVSLLAKLPALPPDSAQTRLLCRIETTLDTFSDTLPLRVRTTAQPRKETFISPMDSSCQYYGILYPRNYNPAHRYALILSLHGASVEAAGLVECFKPKDWAFVVCPTNRRPYGFDWQDWGRLDALEVLDYLLARLPVDPDRVLLTGHSMGGHGTWHIGLAHPDRFAALAALAGWPTIPLYLPWFLQRSLIFAEPEQVGIRDRVIATDNTVVHLPNAANLPVFILHGGEDDNVPTFHGRNFALWLSELGYEYHYKEVPGRGHWWQYESESLCVVDDTDLMNFLQTHRRNPGPRHIRFRTADLGQSNRAYWLTIDRVRTVGRLAEIEAWASDTLIRIETRNIAQVTLHLDERLFFPTPPRLTVDGQNLGKVGSLPAVIRLSRERDTWSKKEPRRHRLAKTPSVYGPARQAYFRPFALVYGTQDPGLTDFLRHTAVQEAMRWWQRGNGLAEVLPDTEVTSDVATRYNLILYGGSTENSYTRRISRHLPIQVRQGRMYLQNKCLGPNLACVFVYPNPENPQKLLLVRMGTDREHAKLSNFWGVLASGTGIPDYVVYDNTVRRWAWAGVRAAGFFDPSWRVTRASSWLQE